MNSEEKTKNGVVKGQPSPSGTRSLWMTTNPVLYVFLAFKGVVTHKTAYRVWEQIPYDRPLPVLHSSFSFETMRSFWEF